MSSKILKQIEEEFACMDCGINTFFTEEYYMLEDKVWLSITKSEERLGVLCISCVEKRLDRKLESNDFSDCSLNKSFICGPKSKCLLNRLLRKPTVRIRTNRRSGKTVGKAITDVKKAPKSTDGREVF